MQPIDLVPEPLPRPASSQVLMLHRGSSSTTNDNHTIVPTQPMLVPRKHRYWYYVTRKMLTMWIFAFRSHVRVFHQRVDRNVLGKWSVRHAHSVPSNHGSTGFKLENNTSKHLYLPQNAPASPGKYLPSPLPINTRFIMLLITHWPIIIGCILLAAVSLFWKIRHNKKVQAPILIAKKLGMITNYDYRLWRKLFLLSFL